LHVADITGLFACGIANAIPVAPIGERLAQQQQLEEEEEEEEEEEGEEAKANVPIQVDQVERNANWKYEADFMRDPFNNTPAPLPPIPSVVVPPTIPLAPSYVINNTNGGIVNVYGNQNKVFILLPTSLLHACIHRLCPSFTMPVHRAASGGFLTYMSVTKTIYYHGFNSGLTCVTLYDVQHDAKSPCPCGSSTSNFADRTAMKYIRKCRKQACSNPPLPSDKPWTGVHSPANPISPMFVRSVFDTYTCVALYFSFPSGKSEKVRISKERNVPSVLDLLLSKITTTKHLDGVTCA
jgi:hypothetical protein